MGGEGKWSETRIEVGRGGEVALHRKGPERDLIRCLRSIGESRSHKSK